MSDLPAGTVTFLFTDVEGSTKLLHEIGAEAYAAALHDHRRVLRDAFARHDGVEVDTEGDAFLVAFPDPAEAIAAAKEAQASLQGGPIRVRMGLHTGTPHLTEQGYVGVDVHKGARIAAAAHGGQVVLSKETRLLLDDRFELLDLGEHRVKDFIAPVWIYQLGDERFPPLKTISNTNLPRPASSFIGREREVAEIGSLLRNGARLVTLTGPGGTGKTRLAIEAAAELVPAFRNGVFWVGLAALRDPALVPETIGQTIGAKDGLADHIGEREMLLLLDNLEQVVAASRELASLVETCPNLRLLVTSRERLRVRGEVEYAVPPLADADAVTLFCDRAQSEPDDTISELCRRLDDLPLALELAAARTTVLTPQQILERLSKRLDLLKGGRDAEARQATLRATIEWSYDLLSAEEETLFARLSVFRGGCTLEAAEAIADADIDVLASLVDKSLLRHVDERFAMLETVRELATERLEASSEADGLRRRHAEHFLALAEKAFPHLRGSPKEWLDRLDSEQDNLRAALDQLKASGETLVALQLAGALYRFWYMRGYFTEGRRSLEDVLRADKRPTAARARGLNGAAVMALNSGDPGTAWLRAEEGLLLNQQLGDDWGATYSVYMLATAATEESDWARAQPLFEESLRRFRELGDEHYVLLATDALAWTYAELGDGKRSQALHEEVLRLARAQSDVGVAALQLGQLATFVLHEGRIREALQMLGEALGLYRNLGSPGGIAEILLGFAEAYALAGRAELAARLLARSAELRKEIGGGPAWWVENKDKTLAAIHAQLDDATFAEAWEGGRRLSVDGAIALALDAVDVADKSAG